MMISRTLRMLRTRPSPQAGADPRGPKRVRPRTPPCGFGGASAAVPRQTHAPIGMRGVHARVVRAPHVRPPRPLPCSPSRTPPVAHVARSCFRDSGAAEHRVRMHIRTHAPMRPHPCTHAPTQIAHASAYHALARIARSEDRRRAESGEGGDVCMACTHDIGILPDLCA
jgi:hypothetical protein